MSAALTTRAQARDRDQLTRERAALQLRLEDGYQRIEQALVTGQDVTHWEDFWVQLLAQYEQVCDALRDLG
ncbi:MAG TPA: hypothetical protein VFN57_17315 [Thermomicrobiaceae bacterium]|nr:hypothetical protein [Thermomicrobiaceae bacterium]